MSKTKPKEFTRRFKTPYVELVPWKTDGEIYWNECTKVLGSTKLSNFWNFNVCKVLRRIHLFLVASRDGHSPSPLGILLQTSI